MFPGRPLTAATISVTTHTCRGHLRQGGPGPDQPHRRDSITTDEAIIDRLAKALHDSDVSDESLQAIVDGAPDYVGNPDDADAVPELQVAMAACVTG